jgi:TRAP-type C4-dicarboxylate transport system substrate-binding protein
VAAALALSSAWAQQKINLTVVAGQPLRALPSLALVPEYFIPEVNKRIQEQKLNIQIEWKEAYAGSLVKPVQILDALKDGVADIGYIPVIFYPDKLPLTNVTFVTPFLTSDTTLIGRVMNRLHATLPAFDAQYEKFNQVRLGGGGIDSYEMLTTFPVRKLEDIKGRKISTAGAALAWLRGTGATPVSSNMMEYYNSTKTGVIDGFIIFPSSFPGMKFPEAAPYISKVGFGAQYATSLTINRDVWRKLPPALQKIMLQVGETWGEMGDKAYMTAGDAGYKALPGFKAQLYEFPREEQVKWAKAMPNIAKEWAASMDKQGLPGSKAVAALMQEARAAGAKPARDWDKE